MTFTSITISFILKVNLDRERIACKTIRDIKGTLTYILIYLVKLKL